MASRSTHPRTAVLTAAALAVALGAAACSGSASGGSGDNKSLTYWSMWKVGEPQQKVIASAIGDFEKQTGIKVDAQWQGRNNLQKLVPALNTNNVPDLVDGPYLKAYPTLVATKQALGLKTAYGEKVDDTTAGKLVPKKYLDSIDIKLTDGQPWMLPYQITTDAIWYNGAKYPKIKANPPKTWSQFVSDLDQVKAQGGEAPLAADGSVPGYNAAWLTTLILREGGPGALMKIAKDKSGQAWKQPEVLDAAKKVQQLVDGGYLIKGYGASKFPFEQQKWASNKAAFIFMGSWLPTESGNYAAKGFDYQSFPFPTTDTHDSMRADFSGFMVPKKAKNPTAAQKFAAFFLSKKYQNAWATDAKVIPVREDAKISPELAGVQKALKSAKSYHQQNDGVAFPGYNEKVFWPNDDKLFLGEMTPKQFVDTMATQQAGYWKGQGQ